MKYLSVKTVTAGIVATTFAVGALAFAHPHEGHKPVDKPAEKVEKQSKKIWPYFGKSEAVDKTKAVEKTKDTEVISIEKMHPKSEEKKSTQSDNDTLTPAEMEKHFEQRAKRVERRLEQAKKRHEADIKRFEKKSNRKTGDITDPNNIRETAKQIESMITDSGIISSFADIMADLVEDIDLENNKNGLVLKFDGKTLGKLKAQSDDKDHFEIQGLGRNLTVDKEIITKNGKTKTRIVIEYDGTGEFDIDL